MRFYRSNFLGRGFTLIELLVVIAIIGLLATIVLISVNSVRTKADQAVLSSNMYTIGKQAEIYNSTNGRYGATWSSSPTSIVSGLGSGVVSYYQGQNPKPFEPSFFSDSTVLRAMDQIFNRVTVPGPGGIGSPTVFWALDPSGSKWAFAAVMLKSGLSNYCIDYLGQTKQNNNAYTNVIDTATFTCI